MRSSAFLLLAVLFVAGCGRQESGKTPVARIGGRTLTVEEIEAALRTEGDLSQAQMQQFMQRWIADELLYREAASRGFDQAEEVNARVEELRRTLAINMLLEKEVYASDATAIPMERVRAYYDVHQDEFVLTQDAALISFALFKERDAATALRNTVLRGTPWHAALMTAGNTLLGRADSVYHTQQSLRPAELWRVTAAARSTDPSFPISTGDGYYVLVVWKLQRQGQTADLLSVEREIRQRLTVEDRRQRFESLVDSLRSRQTIEVFLSAGPADSVAVQ